VLSDHISSFLTKYVFIDDKNCSINKAVFNQFLSEEKHRSISRKGEGYYEQDDWKIK
jgi:hypothetical protein